jgi:hypothetical protein
LYRLIVTFLGNITHRVVNNTLFKGSLKRNGEGPDDSDRGSIFGTDIDLLSLSPCTCFAAHSPSAD